MPDNRERSTMPVGSVIPVFSAGDLICDRYEVIRFIARGGMGEVYEVDDRELRTRIALKTVTLSRASSDRQINRFRQEIQLARKVTHPNVCRVFDLGHHKHESHGDVLFLTMELLEGETLATFIHEHGPISCDQALPLIRQIVSGLSAAHQLGIVHRDFKPGNVMLLESAHEPIVKVTDFGLATNPGSEKTVSTLSVEVAGTPEYMAPEQFRGQCSARTDVYALGVTVFQMLSGQLPASHDAPFKALGGDAAKRIEQRWQDAITKSLAMRPAARFATVEDFWHALSGENLAEPSGWKALVAGLWRHHVVTAALVLLALAAVILIWAGVIPSPFSRLPEQKHIAVLPFQNIGNDTSNQVFAEGVAESLTSKLSQLQRYQKSFWVIPSTDARNVRSLQEAYRDLNATLVVTGSIQHTSEGLNLTANLVDPQNHRQLASRFIHVDSTNLDQMQQHVWESVADMLDLQISSQMKEELASGGTTQPGAYELYEQGVGYLHRYDLDDLDRAIGLFNRALAEDSQYALAYAGLGSTYASKYEQTKNPEWIELATQNARRAVELDGQLVPVRATLARVYQQTGQMNRALVEYQRVLEEDPAVIEAEYHIGEVYEAQGKYPQAEEAYRNVISRRPGYWLGYSGLGTFYYNHGQFSKAADQFSAVIELAPDKALGYYNLGAAYMGLGRNEDAINVLKKGLTIAPSCNAWTDLGSAYMYVGRNEEAAAAMKEAADLSPHNHVMWRNLGDSYHQIPSRLADAKQAYQKALETATAQLKVNPNNTEVLSGIALYDAHLDRTKDAERYISRALELSPKNSDTLFTSALVYEIIGHRDKALRALDEAVKAGYSLDEIEKEPELRGLQADPRYEQWLKQEKTRTSSTI
jgi:serine/threonine protein kinase/tetratricopeptide (TPR) repeat protein